MPEPRRWAASALAGLAGASLWVSLGTVAVTDGQTLARMAALPPLWALVLLVVAAAAAASVLRLPLGRAWPLALCGLLWLPYVPGRIPAAWLIWNGPLEGLIWGAVAIGLLWEPLGALTRWGRPLFADPRRAPWIATVVAVACWSAAFALVRDRIPGGDEPHYLVITQSLLGDGDLRIENNHKQGDYLPYFHGVLRPDFLQRGADRQIYSIHSPGISMVILPAFAAAGYLGAVATVIACAALASALAWTTAWMLTASIGGAWTGWAGVCVSAPFFLHSFTIYPDGTGALLTIVGIWLIVHFENRRDVSRLTLFGVGVALAALPWLHTRFALIAGSIGLVVVGRLMTRPGARARIAVFLGVPAVSAVAWFGYFWMIWGRLDPSAPYGGSTNTAVANIWRGATGLLIDQQFGLIANAPVLAIAVAGWLSLVRHKPRLAIELLGITAPYFIAAASYAMWWGGVSAPARFLVVILPVAAVPMSWWWRQRTSLAWRALTILLVLLSAALTLARVSVAGGRLLYNSRDGFDLVLDWASRSADLSLAFPSVHRGTTMSAIADGAVWVAAGLGLAAMAYGLSTKVSRRAEPVWTVMAGASAVAVMFATSVVWARQSNPVVTPSRSQVAALGAWQPSWQTTRFSLRPFRALAEEEFMRRFAIASTDRDVRSTTDSVLLAASLLPAADYEIVTEASARMSGAIAATAGRSDQPIERWRLDGRSPGFGGVLLPLPIPVQSVTIRGDIEAVASAPELTLRVKGLRSRGLAGGRSALRAARYGRVRVFFVDDRAFMEPTGFWTRAEDSTTVVIDADEDARTMGLTVVLRTGLVATTVEIVSGAWSRQLAMPAQQTQRLVLPPPPAGQDAWVVTLRTGAGFRPFDQDPANQDVRNLGVWVEVR